MNLNRKLLVFIIFLSIIPSFLPLFSFKPSEFPELYWNSIWGIISVVCSLAGATLLAWEIILRNRFITKYFTKDILRINKIHQFIGKWGMLAIFVHPIAIMFSYGFEWTWIFYAEINSDFTQHIAFGRFAFNLLLIVWISSAILRSRIKFRPWSYIHLLVYPLTFFVFLHAREIGTTIESSEILSTFWNFSIPAILVLIFVRILYAGALFSKVYKIVSIKKLTEEIYEVVISPNSKFIIPKAGQFVYLQLRRFGETHPFSVVNFNNKNGELVFCIKSSGKFTEKLSKVEIGGKIFVDGPYGIFSNEISTEKNKKHILIAGGIGITPFIMRTKEKNNNLYLLNCNRKLAQIIYRDELKKILGGNYYDFISQETHIEKNLFCNKLDWNCLNEIIPKDELVKSNYYICGSKRFNTGIKQMLLTNGINANQIFEEAFFS